MSDNPSLAVKRSAQSVAPGAIPKIKYLRLWRNLPYARRAELDEDEK